MDINKLKLLMVVAISTLFAFCFAELFVRTLDLKPKPLDPLPIPSYRLSDNPILRYEYRPNYKPTDIPFDSAHKGYQINKDGFRDHEYSTNKPEGVIRIIALGDSTTAGNGIPNINDIYSKKLEKELNSTFSGKRFQVLNMGVGGYHTVQEIEILKTKGLQYKPNIVFVTFCINDFNLESDGGVYKVLLHENTNYTHNFKSSLYKRLLRKSRLLFFAHYRIKSLFPEENKENPTEWYRKNVLKGETTVKVGLEMLSNLQQEYGFKTSLYILPAFDKNFDRYMYKKVHLTVSKIAKNYPNITVADLMTDFRKVNNRAGIFSYDGIHLNEYGHEVLSLILSEKIKKELKK